MMDHDMLRTPTEAELALIAKVRRTAMLNDLVHGHVDGFRFIASSPIIPVSWRSEGHKPIDAKFRHGQVQDAGPLLMNGVRHRTFRIVALDQDFTWVPALGKVIVSEEKNR